MITLTKEMRKLMFGSSFSPSLNIGDALANFHSVGKIPMLIDFVNICVSNGGTILPAIGVSSTPAALLSFNLIRSLQTPSTVGAFGENVVYVSSR